MLEKERNRKRFFPTASQEFQPEIPARRTSSEELIQDFRRLVKHSLGEIGLGVLDARLNGQEMRSLVGNPEFGSPTVSKLKRIVRQIKSLAKDFAGMTKAFCGKWSGRWEGRRPLRVKVRSYFDETTWTG